MENYIFDLYGTLIDVYTNEKCIFTWIKWCRFLDRRGILHPGIFNFKREFFDADRRYRVILKEETGCQIPEIDIINVYRDLFEKYGNGVLDDGLLNEIAYAFRVASRRYIRLFPGVKEYLLRLKSEGKHTYILSNAQRSYTWPEIQMFELDKLTDDQLISSDYGAMKPDKLFFDAIINKYQMNKELTLMHGDSFASDCRGAMAAGIGWVHLAKENHPKKYFRERLK